MSPALPDLYSLCTLRMIVTELRNNAIDHPIVGTSAAECGPVKGGGAGQAEGQARVHLTGASSARREAIESGFSPRATRFSRSEEFESGRSNRCAVKIAVLIRDERRTGASTVGQACKAVENGFGPTAARFGREFVDGSVAPVGCFVDAALLRGAISSTSI
jgi:hypothetical protein